jgi:hypothetical protein
MQYLLTKDELDAMAPKYDLVMRDLALDDLRAKVLALADRACIHDVVDGRRRGGYCDSCPLSDLRERTVQSAYWCTRTKNYSK